MAIIYLISIFLDTFIIGFHLHPLLFPGVTTWNSCFSALMFVDIILRFFVSFPRASIIEEIEEDDNVETLVGGDPNSSKVSDGQVGDTSVRESQLEQLK